jgi:hypothetical protein
LFCAFENLIASYALPKNKIKKTQNMFRKDIAEALQQRKEIRVDPFRQGFDHANSPQTIDLNAVRLCFQVRYQAVLWIRDVYPGSDFFPSRIRAVSIPDPGSSSKNLSILTQKIGFWSSRKYDPGVHPGFVS